MRYEKIVNKFDNLIETTIELNAKLYEQIMNKKYSNQQSQKIENCVDQKIYEKLLWVHCYEPSKDRTSYYGSNSLNLQEIRVMMLEELTSASMMLELSRPSSIQASCSNARGRRACEHSNIYTSSKSSMDFVFNLKSTFTFILQLFILDTLK